MLFFSMKSWSLVFSTSSSFFSPPTSTVIFTLAAPILTWPILAPDQTSMPRFLKALASSAEQSASSRGRMTGATSTRVTLVPNALKTSANSQPTAPAPTTAIDFGAFSRTRTSSLDSTVVLLSSSPACGSPFTREPVAMTTAFFAVCVSALPSAPVTLTSMPPASVPVPMIVVILFFLKRKSTPLEFCCDTARERFIAGP